ncbi:GIP [Symbiodinium sp. CCMP2592]|nr:GIP [Symbiodinium sp. CCMP2592]
MRTRKEIKDLLERYDNRWRQQRGEPHLWRINDEFEGAVQHDPEENMVRHEAAKVEDPDEDKIKRGAEGISFEDGSKIASEVRSSLRRLHQNLGHPSNTDLARHLRLAGADPTVVEATKKLRCQVCSRHRRAASAKPASLPNILDFNQLVAVDAFYVYDVNGEKVELMIVIDVGTGFIAAGHLQGRSTSTMEASFCSVWSNTFGAPGTMLVDVEPGLQAGLGRYSEWHGTKIRPIAGQAHWQNGAVERAIKTWKEIWVNFADTHSATYEEADMVVTSVNAAMNTLRRDAGFSPAQAVWGRARELSIRSAAKEAYFRCHNFSNPEALQVAGPELQVGSPVLLYRKTNRNKNWAWHGPGVVIGNSWISFAGRCHLVAPEHMRMATGEELGEAFALKGTHRLLEQDFADEEIYEQEDAEMEEDPVLPLLGDDEGSHGQERGEGSRRKQDEVVQPPAEWKQWTEHVERDALEPTVTESREISKSKPGRLGSWLADIATLILPLDWRPARQQYRGSPSSGWLIPCRLVAQVPEGRQEAKSDGNEWVVVQSTLDHCIFMAQCIRGQDDQGEPLLDPPTAYLGVHVDDFLLVGEGGLCDLLKKELSAQFPIQDWEADKFDYVGSYIEVLSDCVKVTQASYASTRLFEVETPQDIPDHFEATEAQKHDNQSLIEALSRMACQTRPDLLVVVSISQQRQKAPTVGDLKFTNQLGRRASEHREQGLVFYPVNLASAVLLCYHDAGWANARNPRKDAKTKKANSTIASQLGGVYILADKDILRGVAASSTGKVELENESADLPSQRHGDGPTGVRGLDF